MSSATLTINVGSSSVKCALFTYAAQPVAIGRQTIDGDIASCAPRIIDWANQAASTTAITAIGHRMVHGGPLYRAPQRLTKELLADLGEFVPFAPNHLPAELAMIDAMAQQMATVPQVACFDTAFHADLPEVARRLPIPAPYDSQGVQRYGFHGLSYAFLLEELERIAGHDAAAGRLILAHLGNGSSLAAVYQGRSVDTTMGLTPIGGVVMSTRSGDLDPGVITYLARTEQLSADDIETLLSRRAGLLALSGTTGDMRTLLQRESIDPGCRLAVSAYVYSVKKAIGALTAALGGLDTLVFSGGIGEHAPAVRARIADGLTFLGVEVESQRNDANDAIISPSTSRVVVRVIPTDEELMIARAVYRALAEQSPL